MSEAVAYKSAERRGETFSYLPPFNYQPDLFWDVSDEKAERKLPPGLAK